jgi:serine protease
MRTLLIGLIGAALVFTYFWYTGYPLASRIKLPFLGELTPPAAAAAPDQRWKDRLAGLRSESRSMRAQFSPKERLVNLNGGPEVYAGWIIAKPKAEPEADATAAAAPTDAELQGRFTARAMRRVEANATAEPLRRNSRALSAANEVGVVDTDGDGNMLINLDYDLIGDAEQEDAQNQQAQQPQQAQPAPPGRQKAGHGQGPAGRAARLARRLALQATVAPDADAAAMARGFGRAATQARPLAFNAGESIRDRAMRGKGRRFRWAAQHRCPDNVELDQLRDNPVDGVNCAIDRLRGSGEFEYVEPNLIVHHEMAKHPGPTIGIGGPNDPLYALQWDLHNQGDAEGKSKGGSSFEDYWTRGNEQGSRDVVVAVIDTGLDKKHPDIANSPNVAWAQGIDMVSVPFYANDGDGRDLDPTDPGDICDPTDPQAEDSYHGTHVAGTIGAVATNDNNGTAGGAWNVTIVPIRALGRCGGLQSDVNDAIRWAAGVEPAYIEVDGKTQTVVNQHPADIINLSLGFDAPDGCPKSTQEAINDAIKAGAIIVVAAGNAGVDVEKYAPSGCDGVITVGASDGAGALAYYSNWGEKVSLLAPGGDLRVDLDGDGRPDGILSTKRSSHCVDPVTSQPIAQCYYSYENGTSMAAPHVSAALALLKSHYPKKSSADLTAMLLKSTRPRTVAQCSAPCSDTSTTTSSTPAVASASAKPASGGTETPEPGMCHRACGQGLLDLSLAVGQ